MLKYRYVAALLALVMFGSFAVAGGGGAGAQVSSGSPYILEIGHAKISAGNDRTQISHSVSDGAGDWHKLFFTPKGRVPVEWSYREVASGRGVLHIAGPAPAGGIVFDLQVVVWEP